MDNFIKTKILEALINATTTPKQQLKLFVQYLSFFKGKLKVLLSGNHERWSKELTGIDWLNNYCKQEDIMYSPDEFRISFFHNDIKYKFPQNMKKNNEMQIKRINLTKFINKLKSAFNICLPRTAVIQRPKNILRNVSISCGR